MLYFNIQYAVCRLKCLIFIEFLIFYDAICFGINNLTVIVLFLRTVCRLKCLIYIEVLNFLMESIGEYSMYLNLLFHSFPWRFFNSLFSPFSIAIPQISKDCLGYLLSSPLMQFKNNVVFKSVRYFITDIFPIALMIN